jgi:FtsZ-binding cell division protein ZapB
LALEAGRQQIIIKQQFTIDQLNQRIEKLQTEISNLNRNNEKCFEEKQRQQDEIQLLMSQLEEAQSSYERYISSIQPIIENHLLKTSLGSKEIDSLRNELGFRYSRVLVTEMNIHSALDEINRLRGVYADLTKQRVSRY